MSILSVNVVQVDTVSPHFNADRLDIATMTGMSYQVITAKDNFVVGDLAFYFPVDSVIPDSFVEKFNISTYYHKKLCAIKLRGIFSEGLLIPVSPEYYEFDKNIKVGDDYTSYFNCTKYEHPVQLCQGKNPNPIGNNRFPAPEHLKKYADTFEDGEIVVITEKIHGSNLCYINTGEEIKIASHNCFWDNTPENQKVPQVLCFNKYPELSKIPAGVKVYGEVYGRGIQDLAYGLSDIVYALFAVVKDGEFLNYPDFIAFCEYYGLKRVPVLYVGEYSYDNIIKFNNADSVISRGQQMMEGICVTPIKERLHPKFGTRICMKYISDRYLLRKGATEGK